ncbi:MAG: AAA family ATPase, partial [Patescibacteria group bacterium]|nr:AAA family ATPase [Patescibacteria group bacterium]
MHGTHVEPFCDTVCATILDCGISRAAISMVKPSGPLARFVRPARKAAAKPASQNNAPVRLRGRIRQREDDGSDEEEDDDERTPPKPAAKAPAVRLLLNAGVTPSAAYTAFEARAEELFETNPRSEPIDLAGFDDPPTLDSLTGLSAEKLLIHQSTLGIMKVPTLAERSGKRAGNTLFYGPGGTGKSTIMRIMAREAGYALYAPSTSELINSYQGESARNFRAVFWSAQLMAMAIHERLRSDYSGSLLALDEADSILGEVPKGSADPGLGSEFKQHVQSTLANPRFIIVAGTNFPDKITDAAILQRFPIKIYIGTPSDEECIQMVLDAIDNLQRKTHPTCRAGQEAKYRALEQAIRT